MEKQQPWFKNRAYGYGWYPCCAEGWLVIITWFLVLVGSTMVLLVAQIGAPSTFWQAVLFVLWALVLIVDTVALLVISRVKGEKSHWRWRR